MTRVALIGANGHGQHHRRVIAGLGGVHLVGLADPQPVEGDPQGARVFRDHRDLLTQTRPDVVVICTPPHTHLAIAEDVLRAGADVLLEKPPVRTLAEHRRLAAVIAETGRACQVGFQALGSHAAARLWDFVASDKVTSIAAVASWQRDDAYYARAPWAGRRQVDGRPVIDGVLVNPLAHALMQALETARAAGAGEWATLEIERYRTRPIEADDTAFARLTYPSNVRLIAAVTLAGEDFIAGDIVVDSPAGRAVLEYPTDRLTLPASDPADPSDRTGLLENLIAHRTTGAPLIAPLDRTAIFTAVLQTITAPDLAPPTLLASPYVENRAGTRIITGINELLRQVAETGSLPSELGVPWATPAEARTPPR
ncbi:Gfo/Idh/MocA family protein [Symbioplanes lichenis]|uniref:Gfo/Idh/MocA family protein n=1 Tax=Symbioplanes lichenis TaxID=1629072 RepID=UPI002738630B|nr:Gfo/Idh/MocA family oxidoreductase [Actinoplanes lichenis]